MSKQSQILSTLVEQAEAAASTRDFPQLVTILTTALSSPHVLSFHPFLSIPLIASSAALPVAIFDQSSTTFSPEHHFQALSILLVIFSSGTLATLTQVLQAAPQPIISLLTVSMFSKLELLTLITIFEEFLLTPTRFNQLAQVHSSPCITLSYVQTQFNTTYSAYSLVNNLATQSINPSLQQLARNHQQLPTWTAQQGYSFTQILSMITKLISSKYITGLLHDLVNDQRGYIELVALHINRDVQLSTQPIIAQPLPSNSLSCLIGCLDTLITATQYSIDATTP